MYGYIYKTTNNVNGKIYIGQHRSDDFDPDYYGSGKILKKAIKKYGIENFSVSVLTYCNSKSEMNSLERQLIKIYDSRNPSIGYNIAYGGEGGDLVSCLSDTDKEKRLNKLRANSYLGTLTFEQRSEMNKRAWRTRRENGNDKFSDEYRKKMSEAHKGTHLSEGTKRKLSEANKGKILSASHRKKISEANKGKHAMSVEMRKKLSDTHKQCIGDKNPFYGKTHTEETKKHIGQKTKEWYKSHSVIWINNGKVSTRIDEAEYLKYEKLGYVRGRLNG